MAAIDFITTIDTESVQNRPRVSTAHMTTIVESCKLKVMRLCECPNSELLVCYEDMLLRYQNVSFENTYAILYTALVSDRPLGCCK